MKTKYRTWKALIKAFQTGKLSKDKYIIVMDNDNSFLRYLGKDMNEDEAYEHCRTLWRGQGYSDIVDILKALKLPAEWV
jgi:hypothetical protein